jgi:hypothetical protein
MPLSLKRDKTACYLPVFEAAKAAIDTQLHELRSNHGGTLEERQALADALHGVNVLREDLETRCRETGLSND